MTTFYAGSCYALAKILLAGGIMVADGKGTLKVQMVPEKTYVVYSSG